MIKLVFFISFLFTDNCRQDYLNKVLSSTSYKSYFLVVKAENNGKLLDIVVVNSKLHNLLKLKSPNFNDIEYYKKYIIERINNNKPIVLSKKEIEKIDAGIILKDSSVLALSDTSNLVFLNKFFYVSEKDNYAVLNQGFDSKKIGAIMKSLFERNYLMSMVEGQLTIENLNFCNEQNKK